MAFQITTLSGSISGSTVPGASTYVDGGVPMFSGSTQVQASEATDGMIFLDPTGSLFVYEQPSALDPATYFTQGSGLAPFFSFDSTTKIHTATWGLLSSTVGITSARNIENSSALWFKLPNFDPNGVYMLSTYCEIIDYTFNGNNGEALLGMMFSNRANIKDANAYYMGGGFRWRPADSLSTNVQYSRCAGLGPEASFGHSSTNVTSGRIGSMRAGVALFPYDTGDNEMIFRNATYMYRNYLGAYLNVTPPNLSNASVRVSMDDGLYIGIFAGSDAKTGGTASDNTCQFRPYVRVTRIY